MGSIDNFWQNTNGIFSQYDHEEISYLEASTLVEAQIDSLLAEHSIDLPDSITETAFEAYADLQVFAYQHEDVSHSEAMRTIEERAIYLFEKTKSPQEIEAIQKPYQDALNGKNEEQSFDTPQQHVDDGDRPGFFGPFSLN